MNTMTENKMSGGRLAAETEAEYHALRARIKAEPDVTDILELAKRRDGSWLYMIRPPLDWVFPKYVIGRTDLMNENPVPLAKCSALWSARAEWDRLTLGKNPA